MKKIFFSFIFLVLFFFNSSDVLAFCQYTITRFDTSPQTSIGPKEVLNFTLEFKYEEKNPTINDMNACNKDRVEVSACTSQIKSSVTNAPACANFRPITCDTSTAICKTTGAVDFNYYPASAFTSLTQLNFDGYVKGSKYTARSTYSVKAVYSGGVETTPPTGGVKPLQVNFDKSLYSKDERAVITVSMSGSNARSLPTEVVNVKMATFVNGQKVGEYSFPRNELERTAKTQVINKVSAPPFTDNNNNIKVEMYDAQSGAKIAEVVGVMAVQGLGVAQTPPAGGGGGGSGTTTPPAGGGGGGSGTTTPPAGGGGGTTPPGTSPTAGCTKADADANKCLYNPLPESDLTKMFLTMARGFLTIIGIWGVMFLIVGGFRLITAAGNEEQLIAAKKTITWAILGVLVAIMSFSIIALVQNFLPVKEIKEVNINGN